MCKTLGVLSTVLRYGVNLDLIGHRQDSINGKKGFWEDEEVSEEEAERKDSALREI